MMELKICNPSYACSNHQNFNVFVVRKICV